MHDLAEAKQEDTNMQKATFKSYLEAKEAAVYLIGNLVPFNYFYDHTVGQVGYVLSVKDKYKQSLVESYQQYGRG